MPRRTNAHVLPRPLDARSPSGSPAWAGADEAYRALAAALFPHEPGEPWGRKKHSRRPESHGRVVFARAGHMAGATAVLNHVSGEIETP